MRRSARNGLRCASTRRPSANPAAVMCFFATGSTGDRSRVMHSICGCFLATSMQSNPVAPPTSHRLRKREKSNLSASASKSCRPVECRDRVQVGRATVLCTPKRRRPPEWSSYLQFLRLTGSLFPGFLVAHLCVPCALWITIIGCSQLTPILAEIYGIAIYGIASSRSRIKKR